MPLSLTYDGAGFSDSALSDLQRAFSSVPESPKIARERSGHIRRAPQPRITVIIDGEAVKRLMKKRGFEVAAVCQAAKLTRDQLAAALDFGELSPEKARRLAVALETDVASIAMGTRTSEDKLWRNKK